MTSSDYLNVENMAKLFGQRWGLRHVSFALQKGGLLGVVGLSGSGKTTLLRCLSGLESPTEGTIHIAGVELSDYLLANRIAMVFQKYANFEWLTARQNLQVALEHEIRTVAGKRLADEMLNELGLLDAADKYVSELSGGMQQRIAFGRALLQEAEIVAFDEPFAALDVLNRRLMQNLLKSKLRLSGKTAVLVTHDVSEAIYVCDKVLVLSNKASEKSLIFESAFGRDQDHQVKSTPEFLKLRAEITEALIAVSEAH